MSDRFFLSGPWDAELVLRGAEAHHLGRVLRAVPGTVVELFDGAGSSAGAEVVSVGKRDVTLRLTSPIVREVKPEFEITLAVAPPKGDRFRWLIEKATELGVDRFIPLRTSRTVVDPGAGRLDKLRQVVLEACKQCRRNRLMVIDEMISLPELIQASHRGTELTLFGDVRGPRVSAELSARRSADQSLFAVIGPEGGFTPEEVSELVAAGAFPASIGPYVLRVETAAIAFASVFCGERMSLAAENT